MVALRGSSGREAGGLVESGASVVPTMGTPHQGVMVTSKDGAQVQISSQMCSGIRLRWRCR